MTLSIEAADLREPLAAEAFLELMELFARGDGPGADAPGLPAETRQRLVPALLERADTSVLLARRDGRVVGFAVCIESFSTFAARPVLNLHDLMVHPDQRRSGVGRALLGAVEACARELGCCKLTLEVLSGNQGAQALYRSFGFAAESQGEAGVASETAFFWERKL